MRIEQIKVYTYDELSDEAKDKAVEKLQDINTNWDWHDFIIEDETARLESLGYSNAEISYSGFYSQGDGASFTAQIDLDKFLAGRRLKTKYKKVLDLYNADEYSAVLHTSGHYSHEYTMQLLTDWPYDYTDREEALFEELETLILEEAREEARAIYSKLQREYEYLNEREQIEDTIRANDYEFTEGGQLW